MAKNRKLLFLTIAVLFQIFFLYQAVFNYHVYTLDPAFCSFAEDFQSDAFSGGYTRGSFYRGTAFPVRPLLIVCLCGCIGTRTFLGKAGFRRSGSFPPVPRPYVFVPPVFLPLPPVYGADRHRDPVSVPASSGSAACLVPKEENGPVEKVSYSVSTPTLTIKAEQLLQKPAKAALLLFFSILSAFFCSFYFL